jgi:hypothetical protein
MLIIGLALLVADCVTPPTATPQAVVLPTAMPTVAGLLPSKTPVPTSASTAVPASATVPSATILPTKMPTATPTRVTPVATEGARLIYRKSVNGQPVLVIVSAEGTGSRTLPLPSGAAVETLAQSVSPDGRWLAFYTGSAEQREKSDLALNLMDLASGQTRLCTRLLSADYPQNFRQAADLLDKQGIKLVEGIDQAQILAEAFMNGIDALAWSPDGHYLAFAGQMDGPSSDLYVHDLQSRATRRLSDGLEQIQSITWSPDGKWILHGSANLVGEGMDIHYYAAAVEGGGLKTLPSSISGIRGWLSPSTYLLTRMSNGPAGTHLLQSVDIETGASKTLWPGTYSSFAHDPVNGVLAVTGAETVGAQTPLALFQVDLSTGKWRKIGEGMSSVEFIGTGDNRFIATSAGKAWFVKADGSLVSTKFSASRVNTSPRLRYGVALGDQLQVYAWGNDLVREIKLARPASALDQIIWRTDAPGLFFKFGSELYALNLTDGQATLVDGSISPAPGKVDAVFAAPADIGPQAIWEIPTRFNAEFDACLSAKKGPRACLIGAMQTLGASPRAVEFTRLAYGDAYMTSFQEYGAVDLAEVIFHPRPYDILRYVLVNGTPRIVYADNDLGRIDITQDPAYPALAHKYPKLMIRESLHHFERMERLGQDGQRFIFNYELVDGCQMCRMGSTALVAFDFRAGQFIGTKLLGLQE